MTATDQMIEFITENPGASSRDVKEGLGLQMSITNVSNILHRLWREGVIENRAPARGPGNPASWYVIESQASEYSRELAREILTDLAEVHKSVREDFLAEKLDELFEKLA